MKKIHTRLIKGTILIFLSIIIGLIIKTIYHLMSFYTIYADNFTLYINRIPESQKFWFLLVGFLILVYMADILLRYLFKIASFSYKELSKKREIRK